MKRELTVEDGKYTFVHEQTDGELFRFYVERHGELWRDLLGDKAVFALFSHTCALEAKLAALPELTRIVLACRDYYRAESANSCGGSLHIVLDDGNLEDDAIAWCRDKSTERGDRAGFELATRLLRLPLWQRELVYARYDEYGR